MWVNYIFICLLYIKYYGSIDLMIISSCCLERYLDCSFAHYFIEVIYLSELKSQLLTVFFSTITPPKLPH